MPRYVTVAQKEILDHLRDGRSVFATVAYALMGPLVITLVSFSGRASSGNGRTVIVSMASVFALVAACTGGVHVAMDTMAGERERRSMVPLLLNPVSRSDLVIGKWCAAIVFSLGSLLLSIAGFVAVQGLPVSGDAPPSSGAWVWVALGLIPLAVLGSAVQLLVSANSRSAKEAQSWLSMVTFVPMIVGMFMVFFPGWVDQWWFVAPVVGQQSLIAHILSGQPVHVLQALGLAMLTIVASAPVLAATTAALNRDELRVV